MRNLLSVVLVSLLAACDPGGRLGPDATLISVRVRDDAGAAAGRNEVVITRPDAARVDARTGGDGNADIELAGPGTYVVRVIPRAGYVAGTDPLTKTVTVDARTRTELRFTLYRTGWAPNPQGQ